MCVCVRVSFAGFASTNKMIVVVRKKQKTKVFPPPPEKNFCKKNNKKKKEKKDYFSPSGKFKYFLSGWGREILAVTLIYSWRRWKVHSEKNVL